MKEIIMMKRKLLNSLILAAFAVPGVALAAGAPTLSEVLDASGVSLSGDIEAAYTHSDSAGGTSYYNSDHSSFKIQQVDVAVAKLPAEGAGGLVELTMGSDAANIVSTGSTPGQIDVTQAYAQYASGNLTAIMGKFNTLAGAEVIKAAGNTNITRSVLFLNAIPFTHTGVRASYKVSDAVSLTGGLNNGWDQTSDANAQKTIELGAALNPAKNFALLAQLYSGAEPGASTGTRTLLDLVATITASDSLNFVLNYDNGSQKDAVPTGKAKWSGLAGYVNYQISDPWSVSARLESFKDDDGFKTGTAQTWKEGTVTVAYAPSKAMVFRGEVRKDTSDQPIFTNGDGKSQNSIAFDAIYKF
jgi:Putative beta-barrel porin-2, OmpL-like. bbp2